MRERPFLPMSLCLRRGYTRAAFFGDLAAGATVAVVALPLAMALAIASGVPPERGLFTAVVAGFLISALGGSNVQIGGPTGAFVVIVYGIVQAHGYAGLVTATAMAGVIVIAMGLARFGALIKFIPYPVTTGFTAGIALIIFSSQIKDLLGLSLGNVPAEFLAQWGAYLGHLGGLNPYALALGAGSLLLLWLCRRFVPKLPGPIVAVVFGAVCTQVFQLPVETIGSRFGGIPAALPAPQWPPFSFELARELLPSAGTIALLAALESLLSAVIADGITGQRHKPDCELVAQGIANVASAVCGGIPATGAIARTVTNVKTGGRTPVAGMFHALVLLAVLLLAAPLASGIPLASLAAILVVVAWNMSERDHFRFLLRAPRSDIAVLLTTFLLTVLADLTLAVGVGMVLAALLFMRRMSEVSHVADVVFEPQAELPAAEPDAVGRHTLPAGVEVYEINGPFFFGVADRLKDVLHSLRRPARVFILRMRKVPALDATGLHALDEFVEKCRRDRTVLVLSGVQPQPLRALQRSGLAGRIGAENLCAHFDLALARTRTLLEAEAA